MERPGLERVGVATLALAGGLIPVAVAVAALLRPERGGGSVPLLVAAAVLVVALAAGAHAWRSGRGPLNGLAARLPAALDGALRRRRGRSLLWLVSALLALVQIARLSAFMTDPELRWGSAFPPVDEGVRHMCMAAYVHAADLSRRGDPNLYAEHHYPAFGPGKLGHQAPSLSSVANLGPYLEDPYEYPPPFLLLPRLALAMSNDFLGIRTAWFALQATLFLLFALALAGAIGGARGLTAGLLVPALWLGLPLTFNLQFGQFHLATMVLAMAGMLAFQRRREVAGGALLAAAVVSKLFPGLLLVYLAVARRWRAVGWTALFSAVYVALGLLVLGPAPFRAFFSYHLPRVASGEAFDFFRRSDLTLASNYGVYGIPFKLERLGVPGIGEALAEPLAWLYTGLLLVAAVLAARKHHDLNDERQPLVWLGLLVLASLRSPLAPNVYTAAPALWLLTLIAVELRRARAVVLLVLAWLSMGSVPPMPGPEATILAWMVGQVVMLSLGFWVVLRRPPGELTSPSR